MTKIRIDKIVYESYVDGPGQRSVLFLQGCPLACVGCQNRHLWPAEGGQLKDVDDVAEDLAIGAAIEQGFPVNGPRLTISGGEPFAQPEALAKLLVRLRQHGAGHIIVYSGYTLEQLRERALPAIEKALGLIDVLVDGPYQIEHDSPWMQYRGSANQRVIDLPATLASGELVLLDWDRPELIITKTGQVLGTGPIIDLLVGLGLGEAGPARRCGQTRS